MARAAREVDLVVVGAGPAGASAATVGAARGLRVALIDRARFPRDKLCGGLVSGRAHGYLTEVFGTLPEGLFHPVRKVRLALGEVPLGLIAEAPLMRMTKRRDFDAALIERAEAAGAQLAVGARVAGIEAGADGCRLRLADGTTLLAPLLIGADGVNSAVARALLGRAHDPARIGFALEVEAPVQHDRDALEIDLGAADWGYGWVFPKARSLTVGVGGVAARNPDMKARLAAYLRRHGIDPAAMRIKGHHLPFGDFKRRPGRGRVLLAGDAAGLVDPITGEGIAWAVRSGALAANVAADALTRGVPATALAAYRAALTPVHVEMRRARFLRGLIFAAPLRGRFAGALARNPQMQRRYLALLNGDLDYADIGPARVLRVVGRMLRAGGAARATARSGG